MIKVSMVRMCLASDDAKRTRRLVRDDVLGSYGDTGHKRSPSLCLTRLPSEAKSRQSFAAKTQLWSWLLSMDKRADVEAAVCAKGDKFRSRRSRMLT